MQREAVENALADATREGELLQEQLRVAGEKRDAQLRALEDMSRTAARAEAEVQEQTQRLAAANEARAEDERRMRAALDRESEHYRLARVVEETERALIESQARRA